MTKVCSEPTIGPKVPIGGKSHTWVAVVCATSFAALGCLFVRYPGLQTDEALFAAPLFRGASGIFGLNLGEHHVPIMFLSYLGAPKTWLIAPILLLPYPIHILIRVPVLLIGSAVILVSSALLYRLHGRRAALVGSVLIATDSMFLLTTTFDWGPVALQHLLTVSFMLLAVRWYHTGAITSLAGASFCCGLAFWDKALFAWVFNGIIAGLAAFLPGIWRRFSWRPISIAVIAFVMGALPLILYNLGAAEKLSTLRSNSRFTASEIPGKWNVLRSTWTGSALFGYLVGEDTASKPRSPHTLVEKISFKIRTFAGEHRTNMLAPAFILALGLSLLLWRTQAQKTILFLLIAIGVAWVQMAVTVGAGGSAHHAILLWPLPHFVLALAFAEASLRLRSTGRWTLAVVTSLLAVTNLLVTNQYLYQLVRNGPSGSWTDGIFGLSDGLQHTPASQIVLPDWGMTDSLTVLSRGKLPVRVVDHPFMPIDESPEKRQADLRILSDENALWVEHTLGNEQFAGVNDAVLAASKREGFAQMMQAIYCDRNGRPVFQAFRSAPKPSPTDALRDRELKTAR